MSVTRYDLEVSEFSDCYGVAMEESINGDYVEYSDYAELESKCDTENYIANALIRKLEAERDRLRKALEKSLPIVIGALRHLRATNNKAALKLTNDLDDIRTALQEAGDA